MPDIFNASNQSKPENNNPSIAGVNLTSDNDNNSASNTENKSLKKNHRCVDDYSEVMRIETPSKNPFNAFAPKPANIHFDSQHTQEQVILLLRQHPVTQVRWIVSSIGLILFPFIFAFIPFFDFLPEKYQLVGLMGWYLIVLGFILQSFLGWFFNVYIISDERVIDVDFYNLLHRDVSSAKIENIEDVTTKSGGSLQSIFDYGTVVIQTAGSQQLIEFELVPQPAKVAKLLNELLIEEEREKIEGRVQ